MAKVKKEPTPEQAARKLRAQLREQAFYALLDASHLPRPTPEYRFAETIGRKWRFDWAFVPQFVAVECEGGVFTMGRHTRGAGYAGDLRKYSCAAVMGWRIIRVMPSQLAKPETVDMIRQALAWVCP